MGSCENQRVGSDYLLGTCVDELEPNCIVGDANAIGTAAVLLSLSRLLARCPPWGERYFIANACT